MSVYAADGFPGCDEGACRAWSPGSSLRAGLAGQMPAASRGRHAVAERTGGPDHIIRESVTAAAAAICPRSGSRYLRGTSAGAITWQWTRLRSSCRCNA